MEKGLSFADIQALYPELAATVGSSQPTPEYIAWKAARLGMITASCFGKITRSRDKKGWSDTAETYMSELIWEHITGIEAGDFSGSAATEWGNTYEEEARKLYEKRSGTTIAKADFIRATGFQLVGGTPDGLNAHKGLEIKCPYSAKAHLNTYFKQEVPSIYQAQVQGHILISGREYCDFVSYDPRIHATRPDLGLFIIEVQREKDTQQALEDLLIEFENELIKRLNFLGVNWKK